MWAQRGAALVQAAALSAVPLARAIQSSNLAPGLVTETLGDIRIDGALAQMLRHHTSTGDEFDDAVRFCQEPFTQSQLDLLLKRMGPGLPIAVDTVHVERKNRSKVLRCDMRLSLHIRWTSGRVLVSTCHLPETMAIAAVGRPLADVVSHPYLPVGLVVGSVEEQYGMWVLQPSATERRLER